MRAHWLAFAALLAAGCLTDPATPCGVGFCAGGKVCDTAHNGCVDPEQLASCRGQADEAACSAPGIADGACFDGVCFPRGCGNGQLEADEVCDDGNNLFGDGCSADCTSDETCGNGVVDSAQGEACDDGNVEDGDGCQAVCVLSSCGDGIVDKFENCDDGDANSDDPDAACRSNCQPAGCGDGITDSGEICDDGNIFAGDGCTPDCASDETCGNGVVDFIVGELCDDRPNLSHDGCAIDCQLEQPIWSTLIQSGLRREGHAMAYDAARRRIVLFGGRAGTTQAFRADTWEWNGTSWNHKPSNGDTPPVRAAHAMAYDASRRRVVLFGGFPNGELNDIWEWDGESWIDMTPREGGPPGRRNPELAYDATRKRIVLFGGERAGTTLDDTWAWDGQGWIELTPATSPPSRTEHAMVFDARRGRIVLFGGRDDSFTELSDVWEWDGDSWMDVTPGSGGPGPRRSHSLTFDAQRARVLLFGGRDGGSDLVGDTWEWDGLAWQDRTPASGSPTPRENHSMAFDPDRGRPILFGGKDAAFTTLSDTWEWDGSSWTELAPITAKPPGRSFHAMAHDPARGRIVLSGGLALSLGDPLPQPHDTWEWNGSSWAEIVSERNSVASSRFAHAMSYDTSRGRVVLFGGTTGSTELNDTWVWDGDAWSDVTPTLSPPPRHSHVMSYDDTRERVVLFGGFGASGPVRDTWEWDGINWTEVTPPDESPSSLNAMAYDPVRRRTVGFGASAGNDFTETWEWDGTDWTEVTPDGKGPPAVSAAMVFDATRQRVTLISEAETWEWTGSSWTEITSPFLNPPARTRHAAAYDAARKETVLFGGSSSNFDDTWTLRHERAGDPGEACELGGFDYDRDGVLGCADPDCWGRCLPECPPDSTPDWPTDCDTGRPHCGDGICNPNLETQRLCPGDCGPPPELCGDFICEGAEDSASCPGDCPL